MSTKAATAVAGSDLALKSGINTHFQYSGTVYQKNSTTPDPHAETVVSAIGVPVFRERLSNITIQNTARQDLAPMKIFAMAGDINSTEAEIRALIHAFATNGTAQLRKFFAITGANEPNKNGSYTGAGHWYDQLVMQTYVIKDQVEIEQAAGNWTGGKPLIVGPALIHEHVPLDTDIANLAAATYTTAGVTYHMADLVDAGDFHWYSGWSGPGNRVNGKDDSGTRPAGVSGLLGSDGLICEESFEIQRARQVYDRMLTGGSGALSSGHWKYTGGTVTTGHGAAFAMCHSEWGTPIDEENKHSAEEWQAKSAIYVPEVLLRDYVLGVSMSIGYQALTDRKTDGLRLGWYNLTDFPSGAFPDYTAVQTLLGYNGGESFTSVGSFTDSVSGALPDCTPLVFSAGSGSYYLYVLREADTIAYLTLDVGHVVEGVSLNGDGTYHLDLSDSLTVWHVKPTGGGGGAPTWTDTHLPDVFVSGPYVDSITATGATSITIIDGGLPPGVALGAVSSGTAPVTGTATTAGAYPVQFRASNGSGHVDSPPMTITIYQAPTFTADSPPLTGTVGQAYGANGDGYVFAATSFPASRFSRGGTAVPGLSMTSDGAYSGTFTTAGSYTMNAVAVVGHGLFGTPTTGASHTIVVTGSGGGGTLPVWQKYSPPDGVTGQQFGDDKDGDGVGDGYRLKADGGAEDCTYTVASGTLPLGMNLSASGMLRSIPTVANDYTFTVNATNSAGTTESPPITITVVDNGGGHGASGSITMALEGTNSAASVYVHFMATAMDPNAEKPQDARFIVAQDVNGDPIFIIRVKASGKLDVDDAAGSSIGKGENFFALFDTDDSARWRASMVFGFDGSKARMILRAYASPEATQYSDVLICETPSTTGVYQVELGNKSGQVYADFDSFSTSPLPLEIAPLNPGEGAAVTHAYTLTNTTATSARIFSRLAVGNVGASVNLAVATDSSMTSPTLAGAQVADGDAFVRHTVTGLTQNTQYYGRLVDPSSGNYFGDPFKFKTFASSGASVRKVAVISCMNNPSGGNTPQIAWDDVAAWGPDSIWMLGDDGYWGQTIPAAASYKKDLQKYDKVYSLLPSARTVIHGAVTDAMTISDHNIHINGDDWGGGLPTDPTEDPTGAFNCPHTKREILAFQAMRPVFTYWDTKGTRTYRGYHYDLSPKIRILVPDFRAPERSNASDADSSSKQMWGADQEAKFFAALDSTKLNVIVCETAWWWNSTGSLRATDKPAAYQTAQQRLLDKLNATGAYTGQSVYKRAWVGGDRHRVSYQSVADGGAHDIVPQYIGSGMYKDALALQASEVVTWSTFLPGNTVDKFAMSGYMQLVITDDGAGNITITANGRDAGSVLLVNDGIVASGSTHVTLPSGGMTADYKGMLVAGDGIVNTKVVIIKGQQVTQPDPTFITDVDPDGGGFTMSHAGKSNQPVADLQIQKPVNLWQMTDYPGGSLTTDTWTV